MPKREWTPRYKLYSKLNGKTPEEMLQHDDEAWPGGIVCGFSLWIQACWREFAKLHGCSNTNKVCLKLGVRTHPEFDEWLTGKVAEEAV